MAKRRLTEVFVNTHVTIIVKSVKLTGPSSGEFKNVTLLGFFLDECDDFIYVGEDLEHVSAAVSKSDVAAIMTTPDDPDFLDIPQGDLQ